MQTISVELFSINELSENAKKKAIEKERSNCDVDLQFTVEYIEEILTCLGFESPKIAYSGFCSQGDGLSFTCDNWQYKKGMLDNIKQVTTSKDVLEIAKGLMLESKTSGYKLAFYVSRGRSCYHSTIINPTRCFQVSEEMYDRLHFLVMDLCKVFYRMLEDDYDYQLSDEYIVDSLLNNEVMFLASGKVWGV